MAESDRAVQGAFILLLAIIAAIGSGLVSHSWGWALLLFPVAVLLLREMFGSER